MIDVTVTEPEITAQISGGAITVPVSNPVVVVTIQDDTISVAVTDSPVIVALENAEVIVSVDDRRISVVLEGSGGAQFAQMLTAAENIAATNLVAINSSGQALKADAGSAAKFAVGYADAAITSGSVGQVNLICGLSGGRTGLTPGAIYYLSATAGGITTTKPTSGIVQQVGVALNSTTLIFHALHAIKI